jgi:peroxiredoxin/tetratricopeptide (TPR) repeat protein
MGWFQDGSVSGGFQNGVVMRNSWLGVVGACVAVGLALEVGADDKTGHSRHGTAFDTGLRQRPWKMEGLGVAHFPITTKVPEVQEWFDQGNALLQSFWYEEAERSFRWCLKLDPECAMAYWGLARTGLSWSTGLAEFPEIQRYKDFLKEAVKRKGALPERERLYIEAWDEAMRAEMPERVKTLTAKLQELVLKYPEDQEARVLFAMFSIEAGNQLGTELVVREVLKALPDHPGAHHTRIHNWDGALARQAIESCVEYGRIAPGIGHSNHMPGHNYSKLGMWHEAALSMDAATRVELRYMNERLALPFETWNYAHNRNYLCYIQEQLGMAEAALRGARDLLAAPLDPQRNAEGGYSTADQGTSAQVRALIKFERWEALLAEGTVAWRDDPATKAIRAYAETIAYAGLGRAVDARARLGDLKVLLKEQAASVPAEVMALDAAIGIMIAETVEMGEKVAEGLVCEAEGNVIDATSLLAAAAAIEKRQRDAGRYNNDPPVEAWPANRLLGDVYRRSGDHKLAVVAYGRALEQERNDAFSLAGLALSHHAMGEVEKAKQYAGRFAYVWSGADAGLRWKAEVEALGLGAEPIADVLAKERVYSVEAQASIGPLEWAPFASPRLECLDTEGKTVRLEDFKGKNVVLVFYLGDTCPHCVEQLVAINGKASELEGLNTVVLAVNSTAPEKNKESEKLGKLGVRLLSDHEHENARRFTSYDDFEEMELHSTTLIDREGRVHWKRTGGDPFMDMDFLLKTLGKMNGDEPMPLTEEGEAE